MIFFRAPLPTFRRAPRKPGRLLGWIAGFVLLWLAPTAMRAAPIPAYLHEALADFSPEVPAGWAYTVTTEQDQRRTTERFDPAKPPIEQWMLLQVDRRPPTAKETAQYIKYKASQSPGATRATYTKNDIEPFSLRLVWEDATQAEFIGSFREQAASSDKMLAHLRLRLVVTKQPASVQQASIELTAPYSPVLTVKMNDLIATIEFAPATADLPRLPRRSSSHFKGRMFFLPIEENLQLTYTDFSKSP